MKGISMFLVLVALVGARAGIVPWSENECPPEQEVNWEIEQLLRHEDCHKFYKCTFGKPVEYVCPDDLYFNLETWQCDWPHNVDCTDRNDPADTTVTEPTTTTTTPAPTTTTTTTTTPVPTTTTTTTTPAPTTTTTTTTTPAPTTTTTTTTTPAPTTTTTTTTPAPTTTTTTTTPAPTTTTTTTTTPAPTTTSSTTTTTTPVPECEVKPEPEIDTESPPEPEEDNDFQANGCPADQHKHWLLPHEADCNLFYYCVRGERVLRQCPSTLHFNPVIQVCDWPQSAGCFWPHARRLQKPFETDLIIEM